MTSTDTCTLDAPTKLQVSSSSDLAGYHYQTDVGRFIAFFWQASSSSHLYVSILLKKWPSWVPIRLAIPVASDAKKNTPITAVNWSNGTKAAVYYLNDNNIIHERLSDNNGSTWRDGELSALSIPTRSFSDLTALLSWDTLTEIYIRLYFQDSENLIRELKASVNNGRWSETLSTGYDKLYAMGGTKIACGGRKDGRSVITQHVERSVQQFWQNLKTRSEDSTWIVLGKNRLEKHLDRGARLGYITGLLQSRFYGHDSGTVTERVWERVPKEQWKSLTTLPTSAGTSSIFPNFIVLSWPPDMDSTSHEVHLFSTDESGRLWDYLVELGTASSASLLEA